MTERGMRMNHSLVWFNVKTGGLYVIVEDNALKEHDRAQMVVYRSLLTGQVWVRPLAEFYDGRFKLLSQEELGLRRTPYD